MERDPLITARQQGIRGSRCGCFYCLRSFDGAEIAQWIDDGRTAICPHCGIDAVISEYERYTITDAELRRRREHSFGGD